MESISASFIRFQCNLHDPGTFFSEFWNFYKLKRSPHFWGEPILRKAWIIWSPLPYSNFKSFKHLYSLSSTRYQYSLYDSGVPFSDFWNFCKLRMVGVISGRELILHKVWIIWSPLLYFSDKSFMNRNSSSFIRFQCILQDSGVLFSES